jgi:hypothetical protein
VQCNDAPCPKLQTQSERRYTGKQLQRCSGPIEQAGGCGGGDGHDVAGRVGGAVVAAGALEVVLEGKRVRLIPCYKTVIVLQRHPHVRVKLEHDPENVACLGESRRHRQRCLRLGKKVSGGVACVQRGAGHRHIMPKSVWNSEAG